MNGREVIVFRTQAALDAAVFGIYRDALAALGYKDWGDWAEPDRAAIQAKVNEIARLRIGREIILDWQ